MATGSPLQARPKSRTSVEASRAGASSRDRQRRYRGTCRGVCRFRAGGPARRRGSAAHSGDSAQCAWRFHPGSRTDRGDPPPPCRRPCQPVDNASAGRVCRGAWLFRRGDRRRAAEHACHPRMASPAPPTAAKAVRPGLRSADLDAVVHLCLAAAAGHAGMVGHCVALLPSARKPGPRPAAHARQAGRAASYGRDLSDASARAAAAPPRIAALRWRAGISCCSCRGRRPVIPKNAGPPNASASSRGRWIRRAFVQ